MSSLNRILILIFNSTVMVKCKLINYLKACSIGKTLVMMLI